MPRVRPLIGVLLTLLIPGIAMAQTPAPLTCEQRAAILDQLVEHIDQSRRHVEIELSALRVRLKVLSDQRETAMKPQTPSPAPPQEPAQ